jgi:hypothetical protein
LKGNYDFVLPLCISFDRPWCGDSIAVASVAFRFGIEVFRSSRWMFLDRFGLRPT